MVSEPITRGEWIVGANTRSAPALRLPYQPAHQLEADDPSQLKRFRARERQPTPGATTRPALRRPQAGTAQRR